MARTKVKTERLTENPITLRLPPALLARLDALVPRIAGGGDDLQLLLTNVTRADAIRVALIEGVKVLERRYGGR